MDDPVAKGIAAMRLLRTMVVEKPLDTPLLKPDLERLRNQAEAGMRKALNRLEVE
jgi:hypothetical protein